MKLRELNTVKSLLFTPRLVKVCMVTFGNVGRCMALT